MPNYLKSFFSFFTPKPTKPNLKLKDKIRLKNPKNVLIVQGKNSLWDGTIQPEDILTVFQQTNTHTLFSVAKNSQKTDKIKKGDVVTISNDSLICLDFEKIN